MFSGLQQEQVFRKCEILWQSPKEGCWPSGYSKDVKHVYFENQIVPGADPETFKPLINGYGKDKRGIYKGTQFDPSLPNNYEPYCGYG